MIEFNQLKYLDSFKLAIFYIYFDHNDNVQTRIIMYICNFIYWFSEKNSKNSKPIQDLWGGDTRNTPNLADHGKLTTNIVEQGFPYTNPFNPFTEYSKSRCSLSILSNQETLRAGHWKKPVPSLHTLCGSFWAFDPNGTNDQEDICTSLEIPHTYNHSTILDGRDKYIVLSKRKQTAEGVCPVGLSFQDPYSPHINQEMKSPPRNHSKRW